MTVFIMIYLNSTLLLMNGEKLLTGLLIRKRDCGMISFNMNGEDNLLVIGGVGPTPITTHTGSNIFHTLASQIIASQMKYTLCVSIHHQVLHDSHYVLHHNDIIYFLQVNGKYLS